MLIFLQAEKGAFIFYFCKGELILLNTDKDHNILSIQGSFLLIDNKPGRCNFHTIIVCSMTSVGICTVQFELLFCLRV